MYRLTRREKRLLYVLVCVGVFMLSLYLLIQPAMKQYNTLSQSYQEADMTRRMMQAAAVQGETIDDQIAAVRKEISRVSRTFYAPMPPEDVDELITRYLDKNELTNGALLLSPYQPVEVGAFVPQVHAITYPYKTHLELAGEVFEGPTEQELLDAAAEPKKATVLKTPMTLQMTGATQNIMQFIDDISREKPILITSFTMVKEEGENATFDLGLDVYMLDRI